MVSLGFLVLACEGARTRTKQARTKEAQRNHIEVWFLWASARTVSEVYSEILYPHILS